ncbi:MAG: GGDEF domain-containing protein, partial [Ruminococcus sp.]|nr:GGDEF domain-containing protein [Ruminococcus sp.]
YLSDEQAVIKFANTDTLTGLYNRRFFYNYLSGVITEPFHIIYLDLDYFKAINDNHGHATGDAVLIRTADLIREYFPDSMIARLVGDEFVVKYDSTDHEEVARICGELETRIEQEFEEYGCGTSLSWGSVFTDGNGFDIDKLMQQSDIRMYESKRSKR